MCDTGSGEARHTEGSTRTPAVEAEDGATTSRCHRRSAVPHPATATAATVPITSRQYNHCCSASSCRLHSGLTFTQLLAGMYTVTAEKFTTTHRCTNVEIEIKNVKNVKT